MRAARDLLPDRVPSYAVGVVVVSLLGVLLRALHLDIPMRYDESVTYLAYASRGWEHVTTSYDNPNNHVFHSLLVGWLTGWLGSHPTVIRLPAFLAGCALVPATAWIGARAHGREVGLLAAVLVATSPVLIEFSTNARGYALVSLCVVLAIGVGWRLAERPGWLWWLAWIEAGVIGIYTVPIAAIPWAGLSVWLAWARVRPEGVDGGWPRALAPLLGASAVIALVVVGLYTGILRQEGLDALIANRFVAPEPYGAFARGAPAELAAILGHWSRGIPAPLAAGAVVAVLAGLVLGGGGRRWLALLGAVAVTAAVALLVTRNFGEPRIWLWAVPIVAVAVAIGVVEALRRTGRPGLGATSVVAAGWGAWMCAYLVLAQPVRAFTETGAVPEVREVVDGMVEEYRDGEAVVGDFVTTEPVRFYLGRRESSNGPEGDPAIERIWVVFNARDSARAHGVRTRLARGGIPPLDQSNPFLTVGDVSVYLFGRPAGSPDLRLLEGIDWHTGVAGRVDQERALALVSRVAEETDSPLARAWLARCAATGCMGLGPDDPPAAVDSATLEAVRQLARVEEVEALFLLGASLEEGWGGTVRPTRAASWYRRAADAGHVLAARKLGDAHSAGRGVERSDSAALEWWTRAAEEGDAEAQLRLGRAYEAGLGTASDLERAGDWYCRSAERGNREAERALARLSPRPPAPGCSGAVR